MCQVCRHHASRGLAVLLSHGLGPNGRDGPTLPPPASAATALAGLVDLGGVTPLNSGRRAGENDGVGGTGDSDFSSCVVFGDDQRQPWKVVQTWLELRHDLTVVALLQVRGR